MFSLKGRKKKERINYEEKQKKIRKVVGKKNRKIKEI